MTYSSAFVLNVLQSNKDFIARESVCRASMYEASDELKQCGWKIVTGTMVEMRRVRRRKAVKPMGISGARSSFFGLLTLGTLGFPSRVEPCRVPPDMAA